MNILKKVTDNLDKLSYGVGIVVAAGGLISAVLDKDKDKDLSKKVKELEQKVDDLSKGK